jgi:hypothetical protein
MRKTFRRWRPLIAAIVLVGFAVVAVQVLVVALQKRAGSMQSDKESAAKALLGR